MANVPCVRYPTIGVDDGRTGYDLNLKAIPAAPQRLVSGARQSRVREPRGPDRGCRATRAVAPAVQRQLPHRGPRQPHNSPRVWAVSHWGGRLRTSFPPRRTQETLMRKLTLVLAATIAVTAANALAGANAQTPAQGATASVTISPEDLQRNIDGRSLPLTLVDELY